jgi:hypothetical protein
MVISNPSISGIKPVILFQGKSWNIALSDEQTKHISIRAHFIRDLWNEGHVDVRLVHPEDNESDICTKNVTEKILSIFSRHIRAGTLRCWRNWNKLNEEKARYLKRGCNDMAVRTYDVRTVGPDRRTNGRLAGWR